VPEFDPGQLPVGSLVATVAVLALLVAARWVAGRLIRSNPRLPASQQRRWIATARNVGFALAVLALVLIWAPQLQTFALSLTAVAVAIVIATKELLLCFSGAFLRSSSRSFSVGDWVEIGGIRGEVIDHSVFATTVFEFEPGAFHFANRKAVIPNSVLLSTPVRNLSAQRDHVHHSFDVTFEASANVFRHRSTIEDIVEKHTAGHRPAAEEVSHALARRAGVDPLTLSPAVRLQTTELGQQRIRIGLLCPLDKAAELQNAITVDLAAAVGPAPRPG